MNIDPVINSALTVLNGSMLLCLVIVITLGKRKLSRKRRKAGPALTLFTEPRQCLLGFKRLGNARHKESIEAWHAQLTSDLPPLTTEDHL